MQVQISHSVGKRRGQIGDVWLYWTATFLGCAMVARTYRKTLLSKSKEMIQWKNSTNLLSHRSNVNNKSSIDRIMSRDRSLRYSFSKIDNEANNIEVCHNFGKEEGCRCHS